MMESVSATATAQGALGALVAAGRRPDPTDPAVIRRTSAQVVSQLFFAPLLAEMRRLPFGRSIGGGGRGEEVFGEQLDLVLADKVAMAPHSRMARIVEDAMHGPRAGASARHAPRLGEAAGPVPANAEGTE
jgi:hypothetical protein